MQNRPIDCRSFIFPRAADDDRNDAVTKQGFSCFRSYPHTTPMGVVGHQCPSVLSERRRLPEQGIRRTPFDPLHMNGRRHDRLNSQLNGVWGGFYKLSSLCGRAGLHLRNQTY